ncbi:MAG: rod shape-determining protein RodA [Pseudomonadota bacterium]
MSYSQRQYRGGWNDSSGSFGVLQRFRLDWPLFIGLLALSFFGLVTLYSASAQEWGAVLRQLLRLCLAFGLMLALTQMHPRYLELWTPWFYILSLILLLAVLVVGDVGKGAQRWLNLGVMRFQPSEFMKLAVPLMVAWYIRDKHLPPSFMHIFVILAIILTPVLLIAKQPDLGTAVIVASAGIAVLFLTGVSWWLIGSFVSLVAAGAPVVWFYLLHDYQRQRILTFVDPENDPLGSGYHIIQSKIAIGSGGLYGKGWLNGTQSQLDFLPERSTDFIFAVHAEEFGLLGGLALLGIYVFIVSRGIGIAYRAQDTYSRLVAGGLILNFFVYVFINMGMVSGLLPVVGVPLPLMSYGGTSVVTLLACFGVIMSIHNHRKLLPS